MFYHQLCSGIQHQIGLFSVVMRVLAGQNTIIHVINGRFVVVSTLLMLATLVYGCFIVVNAGKTPNVVLMLA